MSSELRWVVSQSACCFYAADWVHRGRPLGDGALETAISEPVGLLVREIETCGVPLDRLWPRLMPLSAQIENNNQLAEAALRKAVGSGSQVQTIAPRLAGRIADLEAAVRRARPELVERLAERCTALRQRWEPSALAMLEAVGQLTDPRLVSDRADVVLVPDFSGGGGAAHLLVNSVWLEAATETSGADLPESMRLAWMLAQLNVDLPMFSENLSPGRRAPLAALAMVAPVLAAAEQLELARLDPHAVQAALDGWAIEQPALDVAGRLMQWWETYCESRPPFAVALTALDRMLAQ